MIFLYIFDIILTKGDTTMIKIKLHELLKKHNKSLYWLSQQSGISYPTLHNLANKQPRSIYFRTLDEIMDTLGIDDINELLEKD